MRITKVYMLNGGSGGNFKHVVGVADSRWNMIPTLSGEAWSHHTGNIIYTFKDVDAAWTSLIGNKKGCLCNMITFNNGKEVYI